MQIAVTVEQAEKGWVATAPEVRATAQGDTEDEAISNLISLFDTYPDLLEEVRQAEAKAARHVELVGV